MTFKSTFVILLKNTTLWKNKHFYFSKVVNKVCVYICIYTMYICLYTMYIQLLFAAIAAFTYTINIYSFLSLKFIKSFYFSHNFENQDIIMLCTDSLVSFLLCVLERQVRTNFVDGLTNWLIYLSIYLHAYLPSYSPTRNVNNRIC